MNTTYERFIYFKSFCIFFVFAGHKIGLITIHILLQSCAHRKVYINATCALCTLKLCNLNQLHK